MWNRTSIRSGFVALLVLCVVVAGAFTVGAFAQDSPTARATADDDPADPDSNLPDEEVTTYSVTTNATETFTFNATRGEAFAVVATLDENTSGDRDVQVTVTDENGTETENVPGGQPNDISDAEFGDYTAKAADVAETNQTYTVTVEALGEGERQYNLTIGREQPDRYDPNEDVESPTTVGANATVDAVAASYDDDAFAVTLSDGDKLDIDVRSDVNDRDWHEYVSVTGPDGERILVSDYRPSFRAQQNGTYTVSVTFGPRAAEDADLSLEAYTLDLERSPADTIEEPVRDDPDTSDPTEGTDDTTDDTNDCPQT